MASIKRYIKLFQIKIFYIFYKTNWLYRTDKKNQIVIADILSKQYWGLSQSVEVSWVEVTGKTPCVGKAEETPGFLENVSEEVEMEKWHLTGLLIKRRVTNRNQHKDKARSETQMRNFSADISDIWTPTIILTWPGGCGNWTHY